MATGGSGLNTAVLGPGGDVCGEIIVTDSKGV